MAGWTFAWTLFQWWAVIGWPEGLPVLLGAAAAAGSLGAVGVAVWWDIRRDIGRVGTPARPATARRRAA